MATQPKAVEFQSLLHQGISLLEIVSHEKMGPIIRVSIPSSSGHQFTELFSGFLLNRFICSFQSLLHQGISLLASGAATSLTWKSGSVSIPSSSGHQFTAGRPCSSAWRQTSGGFNPFFIRASVYCRATTGRGDAPGSPSFQSLLHQGISLLRWSDCDESADAAAVSIPSSSGHQFTVESAINDRMEKELTFQSLLHQGISLLAVFT